MASTSPKRKKKNTAYSTHEYNVTKVTPTGDQTEVNTVLGSRDAFHKQLEIEQAGFFAIVHNNTLDTEEYRTPGCEKS
jgi:hypothetical protein